MFTILPNLLESRCIDSLAIVPRSSDISPVCDHVQQLETDTPAVGTYTEANNSLSTISASVVRPGTIETERMTRPSRDRALRVVVWLHETPEAHIDISGIPVTAR